MKNQKGFTLIELLLVLAIIGIISAIAIPALLGQRERAKATATKDNTVSVCADLTSTLAVVGDPPSERPAAMAATLWTTSAADYLAKANEAVKFTTGANGKTNFTNAKNPYNGGTVYTAGVPTVAAANAGIVYIDTATANVASNPIITVTGIYKDNNGVAQSLVKTVPCD